MINTTILKNISAPIKLADAPPEVIKEVQRCLGIPVDGIPGPQTINAFQLWKQVHHLGDPDTLGPTTAAKLLELSIVVTTLQATAIFGRMPTPEQMADLNACSTRFTINTPARLRHFLSQVSHETCGLRYLRELASGDAYEGRKDLGNTHPGWGRLYRGGGALQTTGRHNYEKLCKEVGDPKVLELGADYVAQHYPFTSAGIFWRDSHLNALCDRGATVEQVTKVVNGGQNGLLDRKKYYAIACKVIQ